MRIQVILLHQAPSVLFPSPSPYLGILNYQYSQWRSLRLPSTQGRGYKDPHLSKDQNSPTLGLSVREGHFSFGLCRHQDPLKMKSDSLEEERVRRQI